MVEDTLSHDLKAKDVGTLLEDRRRRRRHGSRQDTANVGMMTAGRGEEDDLAFARG